MSADDTPSIVARYAAQQPHIRLLKNPKKITPCALNLGIQQARGEIIMRMDAHTGYDSRYIGKCVQAMQRYPADNVGGIWEIAPRDDTSVGKAIACALSHPFGVGNAHYRHMESSTPIWVDTVPFFCYRKTTIQKIGLFNENLPRGQDMEYNLRLQKAGGKTLLAPDIVSTYYARSDFRSFWNHNWTNGVWVILPFLHSNVMPVSWRHLVPLAFVAATGVSTIMALFSPLGRFLLGCILGSYFILAAAASFEISRREKDGRYFFIMPFIFAGLHVSYGLGSLSGLGQAAAQILKNRLGRLGARSANHD
ncbi:MAG: hypothetical protein A3G41_00195 [Elusimicrobia bacterium RIFCSPLOWO2_12_FULL_59_9]|nr:MAG: hypothetical protein A3G41_00195 [Elusimicrobia bacterium RIFCSPLOWO2_12_FULL_59_9]